MVTFTFKVPLPGPELQIWIKFRKNQRFTWKVKANPENPWRKSLLHLPVSDIFLPPIVMHTAFGLRSVNHGSYSSGLPSKIWRFVCSYWPREMFTWWGSPWIPFCKLVYMLGPATCLQCHDLAGNTYISNVMRWQGEPILKSSEISVHLDHGGLRWRLST